MFKANSKIVPIFIIFILFLSLGFYVYGNDVNQKTLDLNYINHQELNYLMQEEVEDNYNYDIDMNDYPEYQEIQENDNFKLYLNNQNHNIALLVKDSNYVWFSTDPNYDGKDAVTGRNHLALTQNRIRSSIYFRTTQFETISSDRYLLHEAREITYEMTSLGYKMNVHLLGARIKFQLNVELLEDGLSYYIPFESVEEGELRLHSIRVFPSFGSTLGDELTGYLFIPDGSGALIRYNTPAKGIAYNQNVYDSDYGYLTLNQERALGIGVLSAQSVRHPVIGIVHGVNKNAFIATIDSGAEYAQIRAEAKSNVTKYFSNSINFQYRQLYFRPTNNTGSGFRISSQDMTPINPRVTYRFLSDNDANYVGMAKAYREKLISDGLIDHNHSRNQIPLHLSFIGSEVVNGLFTKRNVIMTKYQDMLSIVKDIESLEINQLSISLLGKNTNGSHEFGIQNRLGGKSDFNQLKSYLDQKDYNLYLSNEYNFKYYTERDIAKQVGGNIISLLTSSNVFMNNYLLDMVGIEKNHIEILNTLDKLDTGLLIDQSGKTSYTHIDTSRNLHHRFDLIEQISLYFNELKDNEISVAMKNPNQYMYKFASELYDIPMGTSGYQFVTDSVPFVQIALYGFIDMFASNLNFVANRETNLLKMIEYGLFPSYLLTQNDTFLLRGSDDVNTYSSEYSRWKDKINEEYQFINNALSSVSNSVMTNHKYLGDGLVEIRYLTADQNEIIIYINYNNQERIYNSHTILKKNYIVVGG